MFYKDAPQKKTWLTLIVTCVEVRGKVGYAYFYRWDEDYQSYVGVFKPEITDLIHGEACALGAGLKAALGDLGAAKTKLWGLTLHTDSQPIKSMVQQYIERGSISVTNINQHYVVGFNLLLRSLGTDYIRLYPLRIGKHDWMKAGAVRCIENMETKQAVTKTNNKIVLVKKH